MRGRWQWVQLLNSRGREYSEAPIGVLTPHNVPARKDVTSDGDFWLSGRGGMCRTATTASLVTGDPWNFGSMTTLSVSQVVRVARWVDSE